MCPCKYVVLNENEIVLFPSTMSHSDLQKLGRITSAGFVRRRDDGVMIAYGESESLGLKCNPDMDQDHLDVLLKQRVRPW